LRGPGNGNSQAGDTAAEPVRPRASHHRRVSSTQIFSYIAHHGRESHGYRYGHGSSDVALADLERGPYTQLDSPSTVNAFHRPRADSPYPRSMSRSRTYTPHPSVHSNVYRTQSRSERNVGYWFFVGIASLFPPLSLAFGFGAFDSFITWLNHGRLPDISRHKRVALMSAWISIGVTLGFIAGILIIYEAISRWRSSGRT